MKDCRRRESAVFKWNRRKSVGPLLSEKIWRRGFFCLCTKQVPTKRLCKRILPKFQRNLLAKKGVFDIMRVPLMKEGLCGKEPKAC